MYVNATNIMDPVFVIRDHCLTMEIVTAVVLCASGYFHSPRTTALSVHVTIEELHEQILCTICFHISLGQNCAPIRHQMLGQDQHAFQL